MMHDAHSGKKLQAKPRAVTPEADTIKNDKAMSEQRNAHTVKPYYNNGDKRLDQFTRGLMVYERLLLQR